MRKFKELWHTLWFKIAGGFVFVLCLLLLILSLLINSVTQRAFADYVQNRTAYIEDVVPTILPPPRLFGETEAPPIGPDIPEIVFTPEPFPFEFDNREQRIEVVTRIQPIQIVEEIVSVIVPTTTEVSSLQFLAEIRQGVIIAVVLTGVIAVFLATGLARQVTRPLIQLRQATHALAQGDLTARVAVKSQDEVGKVAAAFNQMADQLEKQEGLRRQMVADVAHELRTPLTVMTSNLEAMQDGLIQPDARELAVLHDEAQRLSRLIEDLRLLSLADAAQLRVRWESVPVNMVVERVAARLRPLAQNSGIELLQVIPTTALNVQGDTDKLQQALTNLVDNALRYTPQGGRVTITAVRENNTLHLSVADTGSGIAPTDLPYLFDRFWRGDKSRSRASGGTGLGLAIVKQIVELHQGTIQVASPDGLGAIFTISLPLQATAK